VPAIAEVTPAAIVQEMYLNETAISTLTVENVGARDLDWNLAVGQSPLKTDLNNLTGARILFHTEEGWADEHLDMVLALGPGARVDFSGGNRFDIMLGADYWRILWVSELPDGFSFFPEDITAVSEFVARGGSVFIEARGSAEVLEYNRILAAIGADIALADAPGLAGTTTDFADHHTTANLTSIDLPQASSSLGAPGADAFVVIRDGAGRDMAALGYVGAGRYVVCADWVLEADAIAANDDNRAFGVRAMGWLYHGSWLEPTITSGTLAPGQQIGVPVQFDTEFVVPGIHQAGLEFSSNDPYVPRRVVPVTLTVTDLCAEVGELTITDVQTLFAFCGQTEVSWTTSAEVPCQFTWGVYGSQQTVTVNLPPGTQHSVVVLTDQRQRYTGVISASLDECGLYTQKPVSWKTPKVCIPVDGNDLPATNQLAMAHPNPFNPTTSLEFGLKSTSHVRLRVYDLRGRMVRTLVDAERPAGWHTVKWVGRDDRGARTASGVYMVIFEAGGVRQHKKVTLLK
jgi:hypothetical protein